jgi:alkylation response protein AidB-like acyl-CoA dehydrogenase
MATRVSADQARETAEAAREQEWKLPSFGKELFLGHLRLDLIYPQPPIDTEARRRGEAFLEKFGDFLAREVDPGEIEREAKIPDRVIDGLKSIGALGMKIEERYGGLGLSQLYYSRALSLAGNYHSAIPTLLSAHQSIGVPEPLRLFGTEAQKEKWLPLVARTHLSAFMLTEPDAGSDPARLTTTAVPTGDGRGYVVNGTKLWGTNGTVADVMVILATVPPSEGHRGGITAFIIPTDSPGVTIEHRNSFMGLRGIENSETRFANVSVPSENVIGREGRGLKIALTTLNTGRLSVPGMVTGTAKWATKVARQYGNRRVQWGKPVGQHDAVAQRIAFIAATSFGLESIVDVTSRMADDQRNDIRIEAALAKLYASELGWRVADELVQVFGGRGYETADSLRARGDIPVPVEQVLRDMRVTRIFEGTSEIMRLTVAREAVDQHLRVAGGLLVPGPARDKAKVAFSAGRFYATWLPKLAVGKGVVPSSYEEFGELAEHLRFVERHARRLARSTFYGMARWQAGLADKEMFLGRLVDIGAELFAITCTVVHAQAVVDDMPDRRPDVMAVSDLFCRQARRRVTGLFADLWSNDEDQGYRLARQVLDGQHEWLEEGMVDPLEAQGGTGVDHPSRKDTRGTRHNDDR